MHKNRDIDFYTIFTKMFKSKTFLLRRAKKNDKIIVRNLQFETPLSQAAVARGVLSLPGIYGGRTVDCRSMETVAAYLERMWKYV